MANDEARSSLYKAHQAGQEKYTYFLLAAAGAAVGFAVQKTEGMKLSWWLLPVAGAILSWGISFICGCKNIQWAHAAISSNATMLELYAGIHPRQPAYAEETAVAIDITRASLASSGRWADFHGKWQMRLLVLGAVFFIAWRVGEMIRIS